MVDLVHEALDLQSFVRTRQWRFCFIGGLAVQAWGEPRLTRDIDLSLMTGFGGEEVFVDTLLERYEPRMPDARDFAMRHRTLLLRTAAGIGIDISLAALPFEDAMMTRAVAVDMFPGQSLQVCSAEDLLIMKVFAGREIDLRDARSVTIRQSRLDWNYIEESLKTIDELRGGTGLVERARDLR